MIEMGKDLMKNFATIAIAVLACATGGFAADAKDVTVSGCAHAGVENGCIVITDKGRTYNISSAKPTPKADTYGTVTGAVFNGMSFCMQGIILKPATWTPDPKKVCPAEKTQ
jgi:hypothetical protein